jgi:hypothetical protein
MALPANAQVNIGIKGVLDPGSFAKSGQRAGDEFKRSFGGSAKDAMSEAFGLGAGAGVGFGAFDQVIGGLKRAGQAVAEFYKTGINFNAELQDAQKGIAGVYLSMAPKQLGTIENAFGAAASNIKQLKQAASEARIPLHDLYESYVGMIKPLTAAGVNTKDQPKLAASLMVAAKMSGVPSAFQGREVMETISGNISARNMVARILGITPDVYQREIQAGTYGKLLSSRVAPFVDANEKLGGNTFNGASGNLSLAYQSLAGIASESTTGQLTKSFNELVKTLSSNDIKNAAKGMDVVASGIVNLSTKLSRFAVPLASGFLGLNAAFDALRYFGRNRNETVSTSGEQPNIDDEFKGFSRSADAGYLSSVAVKAAEREGAFRRKTLTLSQYLVGALNAAKETRDYKIGKASILGEEGQGAYDEALSGFNTEFTRLKELELNAGYERRSRIIAGFLSAGRGNEGAQGGLFQSVGAASAFASGNDLQSQAVSYLKRMVELMTESNLIVKGEATY